MRRPGGSGSRDRALIPVPGRAPEGISAPSASASLGGAVAGLARGRRSAGRPLVPWDRRCRAPRGARLVPSPVRALASTFMTVNPSSEIWGLVSDTRSVHFRLLIELRFIKFRRFVFATLKPSKHFKHLTRSRLGLGTVAVTGCDRIESLGGQAQLPHLQRIMVVIENM